MNTITIV